jgi:hypothetical protein
METAMLPHIIPSYSLSCGQMVSSGRDQRNIEIRVRVILPRLVSSRSVSTRRPGRYKLELFSLSSLLTYSPFPSPQLPTQLLLSTSSSTTKVGILRCLFFG